MNRRVGEALELHGALERRDDGTENAAALFLILCSAALSVAFIVWIFGGFKG